MSKKKINPPCLRDLYRYRKTGCPQTQWDGEDGCMAWIESTFPNQDPTKSPIIVKACMDLINFDYQLEMLKLLEGNQQATELFRNGMCEEGADGKIYPKMNPTPVNITLQNSQPILADYKVE